MLRMPIRWPLVGAGTQKAAFSSDNKILRVGVEGFSDKRLAHLWPIGISGIYQVNAQIKGAAQDSNGFLLVRRWSPDTRTGDTHRAKAQAIDLQISTDGKRSTGFRRSSGCILHYSLLIFFSSHSASPPAAGTHGKTTAHGNNCQRQLLPCAVVFP